MNFLIQRLLVVLLGTYVYVLIITLAHNPLITGITLATTLYIGDYIIGEDTHYNPLVTLVKKLKNKSSNKEFIGVIFCQVLAAYLVFLTEKYYNYLK